LAVPSKEKTMRRTARTAVLFFSLLALTTGSEALATGGDWAAAVDAAQAVDPAIDPPPAETNVRAVGGGDVLGAGSSGNFALSGFRRDDVVDGHLTLNVGFGTNLHADVVCIGAAVLADGTKLARLIGRLTEPEISAQSLIFNISDTGLPGGEGDTWVGSLSPAAPEELPCAPTPGIDPIAHGNISIRFD
jgi:hypothetical protein